MAYQLEEINRAVRADKFGFMEECDHQYQKKVEQAADLICKNMKLSPVVLLSGPSGSGKTTTAHKITAELQRRGAGPHTISLGDYFGRRGPRPAPRTPDGGNDHEAPENMDLPVVSPHFAHPPRGGAPAAPVLQTRRGHAEGCGDTRFRGGDEP